MRLPSADFKSAASAISPPPHMKQADSIATKPSAIISITYLGGYGRIRTDDGGFADPCLIHLATSPEPGVNVERKTRFELATFSLARRCSTTEPLPLMVPRRRIELRTP